MSKGEQCMTKRYTEEEINSRLNKLTSIILISIMSGTLFGFHLYYKNIFITLVLVILIVIYLVALFLTIKK